MNECKGRPGAAKTGGREGRNVGRSSSGGRWAWLHPRLVNPASDGADFSLKPEALLGDGIHSQTGM